MRERTRRGKVPGVHIQIGRRYRHADLTQKRRFARTRRAAHLLHTACNAVQERYAPSLDNEMLEALHGAVVRLLRPQVSSEWSDDEARQRALDIARDLMETPLSGP